MRFTSAVFIAVQVFVSLITESLLVEGGPLSQVENVNPFRDMFLHPTNRKKVVLMCHNKNYLVMIKDKLQGSVNPKIIKKFGKHFIFLLRKSDDISQFLHLAFTLYDKPPHIGLLNQPCFVAKLLRILAKSG